MGRGGGRSIVAEVGQGDGSGGSENITKWCHASGMWMGKTADDFSRSHGWTNFTMCYTEEVLAIMEHLNNGSLMVTTLLSAPLSLGFGAALRLLRLFVASFLC